VRCGSRELERMEQLRLGRANLAVLRSKSVNLPMSLQVEIEDDDE